MSNLPEAPERKDYKTQEDYEEALGFWQSRVGRIQAMVKSQQARKAAKDVQANSKDSQKSQ